LHVKGLGGYYSALKVSKDNSFAALIVSLPLAFTYLSLLIPF
jgi:hypothetical protein